jgi:hypothetical protein
MKRGYQRVVATATRVSLLQIEDARKEAKIMREV